ncbi:MAG: beta strand repeat-containing protein [Janthinobacterium lividum]
MQQLLFMRPAVWHSSRMVQQGRSWLLLLLAVLSSTASVLAQCAAPGSVTVSAITTKSATASFYSASAVNGYTVTTTPTTATYTVAGQGTPTIPATQVLNNLALFTSYTATVQSQCAAGQTASATSTSFVVNPYCNGTSLGGGNTGSITSLSIASAGFSNSTFSTPATGSYYTSYPASVTTATLQPGATYSFTVNLSATYSAVLWIDYNLNGVFDTSEGVQVIPTTGATTGTLSFTVPTTATTGPTGLRVRTRQSGNTNDPSTSCLLYGSGETQDYAVTIGAGTPCTAPPTAGTAVASPTSMCAGGTASISLTGATFGAGLTYQWQSSTTSATTGFTNIAGATNSSYTTPVLGQTTYYRAILTCSGQSATSTVATVTVLAPTYATVPYTQGFENAWLSRCNTNDAPDASWLNTPSTGNPSWRRDDNGATANWTAPTSPTSPYGTGVALGSTLNGATGTHSARFHNYYVNNGDIGKLDLYLNLSGGTGTPTLKFDYVNPDSNPVVVMLSTDGGATFPTTLQTLGTKTVWTSFVLALPSSVTPTTVIRFQGTGNYGSYDNGLDNVSVSYIACAQPTAIASTITTTNATATANITFTPVVGAVSYALTISPAVAGTPATVSSSSFSITGLAYSTTYTITLATNCGGSASQATTYTFTTPCTPPAYASLPYTQDFEGTWISRCGTKEVPDNNWANLPVTGDTSWRRDDDGATANWTAPTSPTNPYGTGVALGSTLNGATGTHSARFHSYYAPSGSTGTFDLYVNLSAAGLKRMTFDYVFPSTAGGKLEVLLSTNGGTTFATTPLLTLTTVTAYTTQTVDLSAVSATAVIRFRATGDYGSYDMGLDNVRVRELPTVDLAPSALATPTTTQGCYGSAETVAVTVRNQGAATLNFANNPATVTAVVTTPGGPQTLTGTITTGTLAAGATQNVTLTPTLNMVALGTYTFAITATVVGDGNTANDVLVPAATRTVAAPVAGTLNASTVSFCQGGGGSSTLTLAGYANGNLQYQQSTSATGPFTNIAGATSAAYTATSLAATTYFRVLISCGANTATSNVFAVTIATTPTATINTPARACTNSPAILSAVVGANTAVRFFSTATGGTALNNNPTAGNVVSASTGNLAASTQYYAEVYTPNGSSEYVGKPSTNGSYGTSSFGGGLYFTTTAAVNIQNVTVYLPAGSAAGSMTVQLFSGSSTSTANFITSTGVTLPANPLTTIAPAVLTLNLPVPAAGQYTLYGTSMTTGIYYDYGTTPLPVTAYPYPSPSTAVTITSSTSGTSYYYFFYNWQVGRDCIVTPRTPIQINVSNPPTSTLFSYPSTTICSGVPASIAPTMAAGATAGTFTVAAAPGISIDPVTGVVSITAAAAASTYTVTNTVEGCATFISTSTFTVTPPTTAAFSYGGSTYCQNGLNPTPTLTSTSTKGGTYSAVSAVDINPSTGAINLINTQPGTYTITYTINTACGSATATQQISVVPVPSASFVYLPGTSCAGAAITIAPILLNGSSLGTFTTIPATGLTINATTGVINLATSAAGTYTITNTVAAGTGCGVVSNTSSFTVNPSPIAPVLTATPNPQGGTLLTSTPAPNYQFNLNGNPIAGATGQTYVINSGRLNGTYTVSVSNALGCTATSNAINVTVTASASALAGTSLTVYPNPTPNGLLTLELSGYRETVALSISNALGQRVFESTVSGSALNQKQALNLSNLAPGVYTLQARTASGGVEIRRIVRE